MSNWIANMLRRYKCDDFRSYENALKEILQELTLLALARVKFFEKAAFYGGTSLRILHGLDRFSEDLDFSLLRADPSFDLSLYEDAVIRELSNLGIDVTFQVKKKTKETAVQSAFLKTNTITHLMNLHVPHSLLQGKHPDAQVKIKVEIDVDPPGDSVGEFIELYHPVFYSVRTYSLPELFAGKMHALLFREWKTRVKGRDWYDFLWYIGRKVPLDLSRLEERLRQTEKWTREGPLTQEQFFELLHDKIERLNVEYSKEDVYPFIDDRRKIEMWSKDYFQRAAEKIAFR